MNNIASFIVYVSAAGTWTCYAVTLDGQQMEVALSSEARASLEAEFTAIGGE